MQLFPAPLEKVTRFYSHSKHHKKLKKRYHALQQKCPYLEFFLSVFSHIWIECGDLLCKSSYLVKIRENTVQKNSEYRHLLRSDDIMGIKGFQQFHAIFIMFLFYYSSNFSQEAWKWYLNVVLWNIFYRPLRHLKVAQTTTNFSTFLAPCPA